MAKETISQTEGLCKEVANCIRNAYDRGYKQGQKDMEQDTMAILENGKMMGRVEAWECCRKLFATMPEKDIEQAFYAEWHNGGFNALMNLDVTDAIRRVKAWEEKQKADSNQVTRQSIIKSQLMDIVNGQKNPVTVDEIAEVLEQLKGVDNGEDTSGL